MKKFLFPYSFSFYWIKLKNKFPKIFIYYSLDVNLCKLYNSDCGVWVDERVTPKEHNWTIPTRSFDVCSTFPSTSTNTKGEEQRGGLYFGVLVIYVCLTRVIRLSARLIAHPVLSLSLRPRKWLSNQIAPNGPELYCTKKSQRQTKRGRLKLNQYFAWSGKNLELRSPMMKLTD